MIEANEKEQTVELLDATCHDAISMAAHLKECATRMEIGDLKNMTGNRISITVVKDADKERLTE